ncbi:MAG TPA: DUF6204 family protein [Thermomicrobiales bacterium]|nr:DUF6204 family protein [Thermomicrobiales bacterium]
MTRTYRATVRGRFGDLTAEQRAMLLAEVDTLRLGFSEEPVLHYDRSLQNFTYRLEIAVDNDVPADADIEAEMDAEERASADLDARGLPFRKLNVAGVTAMDDMKINRPSRLRES